MMYAKVQFGKDLKQRVLERENVESIGYWVYSVYLDWLDCNDLDFLNLLLDLSTMELGYQFAISYEKLNQIADDLIAGKNVKL